LKRRQATGREKIVAFVIGCALLAFANFADFPGLYGAYVQGKVLGLALILTLGLVWGELAKFAIADLGLNTAGPR